MKNAIIFLNGEPPLFGALEHMDFDNAFVICADGALESYVLKFCRPDLVVGDFDSLKDMLLLEGLNCERHPVKKDSTDSQLAVLRAVKEGCDRLQIYGAFGGRPDHEFVNYSLLALADSLGVSAGLRGGVFDVDFVTPARPFVREMKKGKIVSLVPYGGSAHILLTKGLQYRAENTTVDTIDIFTTSNTACGGEVQYRLKSGAALLFSEN